MDYNDYIIRLKSECDSVYDIAQECRSKGYDPRNVVEIPQAHDLADRTQKLLDFLHCRNTAEQIRELTKKHDGNRELVALDIARIVTAESFLYGYKTKCDNCKGTGEIKKTKTWKVTCDDCDGTGVSMGFEDVIKTIKWQNTLKTFNESDKTIAESTLKSLCIYHGICAGLAVLTEGILVAPLEGVVSCRIIKNSDSTEALAVNFAGPIRSAGGTGQALSVLIADILRREFGLEAQIATYEEKERFKEEVSIYSRGLQYRPSNPQIEVICENCPIYIDGEGVGDEVSGQRDLERVPTNKVREGALLVLCEGLVLKAPKILKYTEELGYDEWDWLKAFLPSVKEDEDSIKPSFKFLSDVLAGRPIFGQPMKEGGFRFRYGRSRLAGLATTAIHPATMQALGGFLIVGTQLKYERPGKATVVTPCDSIDGPYVQFKDGSARRVEALPECEGILLTEPEWPIQYIWDMGEILIPVGEFLENSHPLPRSPYVKEWHKLVLEEKGLDYPESFLEALEQCKSGVPLCPDYVPTGLSDVSAQELKTVSDAATVSICGSYVSIPEELREIIYRLNIDIDKEGVITGDAASIIVNNIFKIADTEAPSESTALDFIKNVADYDIMPRTTLRIGARMGKPEGSKHREMKPAIHCLYPVGFKVGNNRLIRDSANLDNRICPDCGKSTTKEVSLCCGETTFKEGVQAGIRVCKVCGIQSIKGVCCGENTIFVGIKDADIGTKTEWIDSLNLCGMAGEPAVKGVKGVTSAERMVEPIVKGILRYKNDTSVFRDGSIRFDMVDIAMTHFRPSEIGLTVAKATELGYTVKDANETVELMPQDIVIPMNCVEGLINATKFNDELLERVYGVKPFYEIENPEDLIGHLAMGIAPHTSGAILCRIIGFAEVKGHYGHPFFHAAKRRNCDGDIDSIILLLDGLVNFSKYFLPKTRGGRMDAPLILTTKIVPAEIDKEALNVDIGENYPLEFYKLTNQDVPPPAKEALKAGVKTVETVLGTPAELTGFKFTHDTTDCAAGPKNNPYNTLETMRRKTMEQFALGEILHSVDNADQAGRLINRHLIRDMRGNLRAYGQQKVRCTKCGTSYRRVPLGGTCNTVTAVRKNPFTGEEEQIICPGNIILTVSHGSVKKYDDLMKDIIERYGCDPYIEALYHQTSSWVKQTFEDKSLKKQTQLW